MHCLGWCHMMSPLKQNDVSKGVSDSHPKKMDASPLDLASNISFEDKYPP